jgi:CheY-like chemotaxis protein
MSRKDGATTPNETPPFRVLVVEDNPADVVWLQHLLAQTQFRHHMFVARDGETAVEFLRKEGKQAFAFDPDLVLLDIHLPKLSGLEVLMEIRSNPRTKDLPVCITTGSEYERDFVVRRYKLDVRCYLLKPITASAFEDALATHEELRPHLAQWRRSA